MGHVPQIKPTGFTCCGFDDPTIKWYRNEEHGCMIPARSPEEAEKIALKGIARDLARCRHFWYNLNVDSKARLARALRAKHIEMTECCLADIRPDDTIGILALPL